jgi:hypothetical protein
VGSRRELIMDGCRGELCGGAALQDAGVRGGVLPTGYDGGSALPAAQGVGWRQNLSSGARWKGTGQAVACTSAGVGGDWRGPEGAVRWRASFFGVR